MKPGEVRCLQLGQISVETSFHKLSILIAT